MTDDQLYDYATALEEYADHLEAILRDHARPTVAEGVARLPKRPERP